MQFTQIYLGLWLLCLASGTIGVIVNATIDDSDSSMVYSPPDAWNDKTCTTCSASGLDQSQLFQGTWHDGTFNSQPGSNNYPNVVLSASTSFRGTAVYVICALARTTASPTGNSDMTFFIDGEQVGTFVKTPPGTAGYDYGVLVYSNTSLKGGSHTIRIDNGHRDGAKSLVLLDRIIYSFESGSGASNSSQTATPSGSSGVPIAAIVAPAVAVPVLVAIGIFLFLWRRRRQRNPVRRRSRGVLDDDVPAQSAAMTHGSWGNGQQPLHQTQSSLLGSVRHAPSHASMSQSGAGSVYSESPYGGVAAEPMPSGYNTSSYGYGASRPGPSGHSITPAPPDAPPPAYDDNEAGTSLHPTGHPPRPATGDRKIRPR